MSEDLDRAIEKVEDALVLKRLDLEELAIASHVIARMIDKTRFAIDSNEEILYMLERERRRL